MNTQLLPGFAAGTRPALASARSVSGCRWTSSAASLRESVLAALSAAVSVRSIRPAIPNSASPVSAPATLPTLQVIHGQAESR